MANLLFLVHRLPYPPNKGDKVRSFHLLKHLAKCHRVFLGTFVDDPDDEVHVARLQEWCAGLHVARLNPLRARLSGLSSLLRGEPLSLGYYRDAGLSAWARSVVQTQRVDATVVFSSAMAQHVPLGAGGPLLVDFVDLDSAKWTAYAEKHRWPMSSVYQREGVRLLAYESALAQRATRSFFVTDQEAALFRAAAPEAAARVDYFGNGVDTTYFSPQSNRASPFQNGEMPLVFTGAMDYWPNVDAVSWFAQEILPILRKRWPRLRLHIVGRNATREVQALASDAVNVTGAVADVRPFLQHARLVVAPLRLARGVQNKVLEAMAMARPVVAAQPCVQALDAAAGDGLMAADNVEDYVREIDSLLASPDKADQFGLAARRCVLDRFTWEAHLSRLDRHLLA